MRIDAESDGTFLINKTLGPFSVHKSAGKASKQAKNTDKKIGSISDTATNRLFGIDIKKEGEIEERIAEKQVENNQSTGPFDLPIETYQEDGIRRKSVFKSLRRRLLKQTRSQRRMRMRK